MGGLCLVVSGSYMLVYLVQHVRSLTRAKGFQVFPKREQ